MKGKEINKQDPFKNINPPRIKLKLIYEMTYFDSLRFNVPLG